MAGNKQEILAPQQIVSCDKTDIGCNGGDTPTAYKYVMKAKGMVSEESFPYTSGKNGKNGKCQRSLGKKVVQIKGFAYATPPKRDGLQDVSKKPNEAKMAATMATKGPVSVCVDASKWQNYKKGGILTRSCGNELDHCVQAVGYEKGQDGKGGYWIVRNSWNTDWGNKGYVYVGYGGDYCGIANEATVVEV
jgi:hypothetical protein